MVGGWKSAFIFCSSQHLLLVSFSSSLTFSVFFDVFSISCCIFSWALLSLAFSYIMSSVLNIPIFMTLEFNFMSLAPESVLSSGLLYRILDGISTTWPNTEFVSSPFHPWTYFCKSCLLIHVINLQIVFAMLFNEFYGLKNV